MKCNGGSELEPSEGWQLMLTSIEKKKKAVRVLFVHSEVLTK
jgi:hypothetical protein